MKYLCLVYEREEVLNALGREESAGLRSENVAYVEDLTGRWRQGLPEERRYEQ